MGASSRGGQSSTVGAWLCSASRRFETPPGWIGLCRRSVRRWVEDDSSAFGRLCFLSYYDAVGRPVRIRFLLITGVRFSRDGVFYVNRETGCFMSTGKVTELIECGNECL